MLESSNYLGQTGARTIFSIQTNSGKLIRGHSYFENEDEILLPPGRYLKVIGNLNSGAGLHIIQLRETDAPYPMLAEPFDLSQMKQALPQPKAPTTTSSSQKKKQDNYSTESVAPVSTIQASSKKGNFTLSYHMQKSS